jgi:hypothetical protein
LWQRVDSETRGDICRKDVKDVFRFQGWKQSIENDGNSSDTFSMDVGCKFWESLAKVGSVAPEFEISGHTSRVGTFLSLQPTLHLRVFQSTS